MKRAIINCLSPNRKFIGEPACPAGRHHLPDLIKLNYKQMKRAVLFVALFTQSNYVHQVIILNEGQYTFWNSTQVTPVSLGSYDPLADSYAVFETLNNVRTGSDLLIDGDNIYVAADSILFVYDKNTLTVTSSTVIKGLRKLAVWNDQLLVTIGEDAIAHNAYFKVYDKNSLAFIYELDTAAGPIYSVEGVSVVNDTAYIAINNALLDWMNPTGIIGIVDLNNQTYAGEVNMGVDGINPDNLMINGTKIYTLNNKDFAGSSITEYNTIDRSVVTTNLTAPAGCGSSALANNKVFYHINVYDSLWNDINTQVHKFDVSTQLVDSVNPSILGLYGMEDDQINAYFYITTTDYTSFGMAYKMQYDGTIIDSFAVGVSPGTLALDIRSLVTMDEKSAESQIIIYPSVTEDMITVELSSFTKIRIGILNTVGQLIKEVASQGQKANIDVTDLRSGLYFITVDTDTSSLTQRFVKK